MAAGIRRIPLPASDYQLDEDGWIDVLSRANGELLLAVTMTPDADMRVRAGLQSFIQGWAVKFDGEVMPFSKETALNLPLEVFEMVATELQKLPLARKAAAPKP